MPANLPPEYFEAERRFREAGSPAEKVAALKELIATVPKHKGTDKLRADLRRKLSRLKEEARKRKKTARTDLYTVEREGAAQLALVGFPNSGKSSLLGSLTKARPVIADYPISTVMPLSGMMPFEDIQFQLVDLPPIGNESTDGWVSGILRNADGLLIVLDLTEDPEVQAELILEQLSRWRMPLRGLEGGDRGKKGVVLAANKIDRPGSEEALERLREGFGDRFPLAAVSALRGDGLPELREMIFRVSEIIRVYTKEPGKEPDLDQPFILPSGSTVLRLAEMIHKDFTKKMKYTCLWGSSKFPGQRVQKDYILRDRDIVEFHL